jgi:hypothetical protein
MRARLSDRLSDRQERQYEYLPSLARVGNSDGISVLEKTPLLSPLGAGREGR